MSPRPRLCDLFTNKVNVISEDANAKAGTRIVVETIESRIIDGGGAAYSIRGKFIKSSGQKIFEVGEVVNVLFKENDPIVILGHTWRKAQFDPIPPIEEIPGDWQNVTFQRSPPFQAGNKPIVFLSNLKDTFVFDLTDFGLVSGDVVLHVGFCVNDPSVILVVTATGSAPTIATLILLKIKRARTSSTVPTSGTLLVQPTSFPPPVEFPKLDVSEISRQVIASDALVLRTLSIDIDFQYKLLAPFLLFDGDISVSPPVDGSSVTDEVREASLAISGSTTFGMNFSSGSYFCVRNEDDLFDVFVLMTETQIESSIPSTVPFVRPIQVFAASGGFTPPFDLDDTSDWFFFFPGDPDAGDPSENISRSFSTEEITLSVSNMLAAPLDRTFGAAGLYLVNLRTLQVIQQTVDVSTTLSFTVFAGITDTFTKRRFKATIFPPFDPPFTRTNIDFARRSTLSARANPGAPKGTDPPGTDVPPEPTFRLGGGGGLEFNQANSGDPDFIINPSLLVVDAVDYFPPSNPYIVDPLKSEIDGATEDRTGTGRLIFRDVSTFFGGTPPLFVILQPFKGRTLADDTTLPSDVVKSATSPPDRQSYLKFEEQLALPIVNVITSGIVNVSEWRGSSFDTLAQFTVPALDLLVNERFIFLLKSPDLFMIDRKNGSVFLVSPQTVTDLVLLTGGIQLMASRNRLYFPAKVGEPAKGPGLIQVSIDEVGEIVLTPTRRLAALTNPDNFFTTGLPFVIYGLTSVVFPLSLDI